jgi:hypothetical protein
MLVGIIVNEQNARIGNLFISTSGIVSALRRKLISNPNFQKVVAMSRSHKRPYWYICRIGTQEERIRDNRTCRHANKIRLNQGIDDFIKPCQIADWWRGLPHGGRVIWHSPKGTRK